MKKQVLAVLLSAAMVSGTLSQAVVLNVGAADVAADPVVVEEIVDQPDESEVEASAEQPGESSADEATSENEATGNTETESVENAGNGDIQAMPDVVTDQEEAGETEPAEEKSKETAKAVAKVTVEEQNSANGTFCVKIDVSNAASIKKIQVPIWCGNDQDDIRWYDAVKNGSSYYVDVKVSDHKNQTGTYNIHVYLTDEQGTMTCIGTEKTEMNVSAGTLEAKTDSTETNCQISLSGLVSQGIRGKVQFAVWSTEGGQDDLRWYDASANGGEYQYSVPIKNHKTAGTYAVHAYLTGNDGQAYILKTAEFQVTKPEKATVSVSEQNLSAGTFQVKIDGLSSVSGIEKVQVPVWCSSDQSDIIWYDAKKNGNAYYVDVKISDHQYHTGTYSIHVYETEKNGLFTCIGTASADANVSAGSVSAKDKNEDGSVFHVEASDVVSQGMSTVKAAVWSEKNGQDDIIWYDMKQSGKTYSVDVPITSHKNTGKYNVHLYLQDRKGGMHFLTKTEFEITESQTSDIQARIDKKDDQKGTFRVVVSGVKSARKVQIPVWCDKDQKDIKWYDAKKDGADYYADVNISNHKYNTGDYKIHVYMTTMDDTLKCIASTSSEVKISAEAVTAADKDQNQTQNTYQVKVSGVVTQGMDTMQIAVWSEKNGQDDIRWYNAEKVNSSEYQLDVPVKNHKDAGTYNVHVYLKDKNSGMHFLGKTTFSVDSAKADLTVGSADGNKGTFQVTVSNIISPSGVQKVQIPVWCSSDQSDIKWYDAAKQSDGSYTVTVDVKNHKYHFGNYKVHAYVTMGNGIMNCVSTTSTELKAQNYIYVTQLDSYRARITIINPNEGNVGKITFPTWSTENGQDDIVWYEGTKNADGSWSAEVNGQNHKHSGTYTTHVYNDENGTMTFLGAAPSYSVQALSAQQQRVKSLAQARIAAVAPSGNSWDRLYACFQWSAGIPYVSVSSSIPSGYTPLQWYAIYGFENGYGNCYVMAATFCQMARELGYDAYLVQGYVPSARGGLTPHGWCEIVINGTTYVFDPDFQHETGRNGFQITYGASGTWRYTSYSRVD